MRIFVRMEHLHRINTLSDLNPVARDIVSSIYKYPIVLLSGQLGAGKTTLSKKIASELGIKEELTSPTYTLVNEYELPSGKLLYHFDLYRLKNVDELDGIGFVEYIDSGNVCLIEWPEIAHSYLEGMPIQEVHIQVIDDYREVVIHYNSQTA